MVVNRVRRWHSDNGCCSVGDVDVMDYDTGTSYITVLRLNCQCIRFTAYRLHVATILVSLVLPFIYLELHSYEVRSVTLHIYLAHLWQHLVRHHFDECCNALLLEMWLEILFHMHPV